MKVFISQPMRGKTNEEIKAERKRLIGKAREHYGADIEVVDSFFEAPPEDAPEDARPLWYLGKALQLMSTAQALVLPRGWEWYSGCMVENLAATMYLLDILEV